MKSVIINDKKYRIAKCYSFRNRIIIKLVNIHTEKAKFIGVDSYTDITFGIYKKPSPLSGYISRFIAFISKYKK
jgi:hypothetical protein